MRSLTSWAGLHYSRQTTGSQMKGEWAWVPAGWFRSTLIAQCPMKGSWAVAHISGEAHCLIGWCLLAFVMRWLRASLSPVPVEHKALESTLPGLLSESMWYKGALLMKTPLRVLSGEFCFGVSHLRPLQNISSALFSSKDPWICHRVRTRTNAAEGSSRKMKLAHNGAWIKKICTHVCN